MFAFGQAAHAILVTQKGMELMPPEVQMQSPNHWTTREVSCLIVVLIYTSLKTIVLSIVSCAYISFGEKFIKTFCFFLKLGCLFYCCVEEVFMGFPGGSQVRNPPANSETGVPTLGQEAHLEKGMAIHPSILAWQMPRTEEPGGLQSMGSQRVGHD